jgi:S-adenosylmethionine:tRNA ribosyltransferase-isomerase
MNRTVNISDYDYLLPEERIAKFPVGQRDMSKLLVSRAGKLSQALFRDIGDILPENSLRQAWI